MTILEKARDPELVLLDHAEHEYDEDGNSMGLFGQHFIGWDTAIASDKNADFTAMTVLRTLPDDNVKQIVGVVHERGMSSVAQKRQIILLNQRFQPDLIELRATTFSVCSLWNSRICERIFIRTFMTTKTRKESLFMSLLMAFEQGQIKTPYGNEISRQFTHKLEEELNRFGMQKTGDWKAGVHDDLAMSLALANWEQKEFKGSIVLLDDILPGLDNIITETE